MIKKFKNWYNNLLSFQKIRFWEHITAIVSSILFLLSLYTKYTILEFLIYSLIAIPCFYLSVCAIFELFLRPGDKEMTYKLKKMYKDAEDTINVWFDSSCSDSVKVNIKSTEDSFEILSYYHNKHLLVNSFYVERKRSIVDKETIYYIYAECEGKQNKVVFPEKIENAGYILARFTLAN